MKNLVLLFCLVSSFPGWAQYWNGEAQEFNNFRWYHSSRPTYFYEPDMDPAGFYAPVDGNQIAIRSGSVWIAGYYEQEIWRGSAPTYCLYDHDGCYNGSGPLINNVLFNGTPTHLPEYNRIWKVTKFELDQHTAYFDCIDDPDCNLNLLFPNGYDIPEAFSSWPAMGDVTNGYAQYLAPFFDRDADGIYSAMNGDSPLICGDFAIYRITNDARTMYGTQVEAALGIETHSMMYGFEAESGALFNTLFVNQKMIHRGTQAVYQTYIGPWTDFILGNPYDNRVGTDVERAMYYCFNGDEIDEDVESYAGYGDDHAAVGVKMLRGVYKNPNGIDDPSIYPDIDYYANQTSGWGDGIPDNERLGLYATVSNVSYDSPPVYSLLPHSLFKAHRYMNALSAEAIPMTYGVTGWGEEGNLNARYIFPGTSDPLMAGTNGLDPEYNFDEGWTEINGGLQSGYRRMIGSSGPFFFYPGDVQYLDYAYIFARDSHEPGVDVLETLRSYADDIVGMECGQLPQIVTGTRNYIKDNDWVRLYPNPATTNVTIESGITTGRYSIIDMVGKVVLQGIISSTRTEMDLKGLPSGIYLVKIEGDNHIGVKKLVVK